MIGIMWTQATRFNVYFVQSRAIMLPCKGEFRRNAGKASPRLKIRAPFIFGSADYDTALAFARGWNHRGETNIETLVKQAVVIKLPLYLKRRGLDKV